MIDLSSWWMLGSWRLGFNQSLWGIDLEPEGFPIKKMVKFPGRCELFIQISSPAMIAATRVLLASIWYPNDNRTRLRWVLAQDTVVCRRNALRSEFRTTLSEFAEKAEEKINVCWDDEGRFLSLSFLSSFSASCSLKKMVNFLGRWEVFIQIRLSAVIVAISMLLASIWHPNDYRTWLRWVLAQDRVVCWINASRS